MAVWIPAAAQDVADGPRDEGFGAEHFPQEGLAPFIELLERFGAVPINHHVHSGNRSDDTVHRGNLEELRLLLGRSDFIYVADCKLAGSDNLKEIAAHGGKFVTMLPRTRNEDKRLRRGRPGEHDPMRVVRCVAWSLEVRINEAVLRAEERTDGVFPLACNLDKKKYPKREILLIYKYQPYVEKRFSQLKTDLEVAPVYLKKAHRCAGLVHAYYVALAVPGLIERAVRQGMKRRGIEELPLFPEKRPTKTPTCPRILEAFRGVSWYEFRRGTEVVCFPLKLNKLQKLLLELLEVPQRLYT